MKEPPAHPERGFGQKNGANILKKIETKKDFKRNLRLQRKKYL